MNFSTRSIADSSNVPLGAFEASRTIRPPFGSFVFSVMSAATRAAEFSHAECPSAP